MENGKDEKDKWKRINGKDERINGKGKLKIEKKSKGKKESEGKEEKNTMQINKEERRRWIEDN
jgi:hypothetical protein